jgi:WD40 repeat protein
MSKQHCASSAIMVMILLHSLPMATYGQQHVLEFVKKIGVGWRLDKGGWMSFVSFSPDGTMVVSDGPATPDDVSGGLKLWSFPDGRLIKRLPALTTGISPDWKYYCTHTGVFELETGRPVISLGKNAFAGFAFSPGNRYVAELGASREHAIRVVELSTGKQVSAFGRHDVFGIAMSPDGRTLAAGYWDLVTLWDLASGERLGALQGFRRYVLGLAFSPNGKLLAAGTDLGTLQLWDVGPMTRIASLEIGGGYVSDPVFSPDGRLVAVGIYGTGTAWLVDTATGKVIDHQRVSDLGCGSVAFSPDGRFLITPSTGGLITWPYDQGGTIRVFRVNRR